VGPAFLKCFFYHDDWCQIYDGKTCNCEPDVKFFAEPKRS
jgi:hypothetical protein